ncbi:MAG: hypothetical protein U1E17_04755 [Geminicoccaceae bacterium]
MLVYETRANRTLRSAGFWPSTAAPGRCPAPSRQHCSAFVLGGLVEGTAHAWLAPYADPAVLAVVCLVIAPLPIGTIRQALSGSSLLAPPGLVEEVEAVARATAAARPARLSRLCPRRRSAGRGRWRSTSSCRRTGRSAMCAPSMRSATVGAAIGGEYFGRWLTITFTGDPEWAR